MNKKPALDADVEAKWRADMETLFKEAEAKALWFYWDYQEQWLAPRELRKLQAEGTYRMAASTWALRHPHERISELDNKIAVARREKGMFLARLAAETNEPPTATMTVEAKAEPKVELKSETKKK